MATPNNTSDQQLASKWDDSEFHSGDRPGWLLRNKRQVLLFAVLATLTLVVVIWLPRLVAPVKLEPADSAGGTAADSDNRSAAAGSSGALEAPWEEAQITRARRQAQEILAKLLDRQNNLESMNVEQWAADGFASAMQAAAQGDDQYTGREFAAALASYETALQQLDELVARSGEEFAQALERGNEALIAQASEQALQQFSLALAIDAEDDIAQQGMQRATVLDQVVARLDQAYNLLDTDLDTALQITATALELDPLSAAARQQREDIQARIRERDFGAAMGSGFEQLQTGRYQQAEQKFQQALTIKPGNPDAISALATTRNQQLQSRIKQNLQQAEKFEAAEQWAEAQELYAKVQALDDSLVSARVGVLRSGAREQLDRRLQKLIEEPLRLSDAQVFQQAQTLLRDARQVQPRGERIDAQARQLQEAIDKSQLPVAIRLQSDNKTEVTLYRIGKLGSFREHSLDLKPGRYTLVGNRQGFRDVREEFTVEPGKQLLTIVIQCTEKISLDG